MRKLLTLCALLAIASVAIAQVQMMPLDGAWSTPTPPDSASFMWSWSTTMQMRWTSGYCYGLAAAATLLRYGMTSDELYDRVSVLERQSLDITRRSILYSVSRDDRPWYVSPVLELLR